MKPIHVRATGRHLPYEPYEITVLPARRHKWTHPALIPARQAGTWFTYPGGMEGWVDLELVFAYQLPLIQSID